ncbi:MAG: TDP-N-acetylfucosamine:lipid II N-acetylfucosaminyltransferase [bacterium]
MIKERLHSEKFINNLHIVHNDKFTDGYILFINENFNKKDNYFIVIGNNNRSQNEGFSLYDVDNVKHIKSLKSFRNFICIEQFMYRAKKIHVNGLFNIYLIMALCFQPWLLRKSNWIIWGADLYNYKKTNRGWKEQIAESMKSFVIKRFSEITANIIGDYEIAKTVYKTNAKYNKIEGFTKDTYRHFIDDLNTKPNQKDNKETIFQVGNSADPSNNHIEILSKLLEFKNKKIKIIVPLSYGNEEHKKRVLDYGNKNFGDIFKPLIEFYPKEDYLKLLSTVDIGIFNHKRQQGLGNINTLLRLGKKVYIRSDISSWDHYNNNNINIYDTLSFFEESFEDAIYFDIKNSIANIKRMKEIRSKDKKVQYWDKILV